MDNFGDIIKLAIMVLIFVIGIVSSENKKKKKAEDAKKKAPQNPTTTTPQVDTSEEKGLPSLEEVLREMMGHPAPAKKPQLAYTPPKPKIQTPKPINYTPATSFLESGKEGASSVPIQVIEHDTFSEMDDLEFDNKDELRKAIIYSEIINRRY